MLVFGLCSFHPFIFKHCALDIVHHFYPSKLLNIDAPYIIIITTSSTLIVNVLQLFMITCVIIFHTFTDHIEIVFDAMVILMQQASMLLT